MALNKEKMKKRLRLTDSKKMVAATSSKQSKAFKLPAGVDRMAVKAQTEPYEFDVVPYAAGEGNTTADPGSPAACRPYFAHNGVGPNRDTYGCNARNFGEPCPICEERAEYEKDHPSPSEDEKKIIRNMLPSQRALWNVRKKGEKSVRVFDISHHAFGKLLNTKTAIKPRYGAFADPDEGSTLSVVFGEEKAGGGFAYPKAADIEFLERDPLPDEVLEQAVCLDDCIVKHKYLEVKSAFLGAASDDAEGHDDADEPPQARNGKAKADADADADDQGAGDDEPAPRKAPAKPAGKATAKPAADADDDAPSVEVGDTVSFVYKEKKKTGEVTDVLAAKGLVKVVCPDRDLPYTVEIDEVKVVRAAAADADAEEFKVGDWVKHPKYGLCEIIKVAEGGVKLEDEDGNAFANVDPAKLTPAKPPQADAGDDEPDDDKGGDEEPDEEPVRKPAAGRKR